jgi:hypothetical protein
MPFSTATRYRSSVPLVPATGRPVAASAYVREPETGYAMTGSVGLGDGLTVGLGGRLGNGLGDVAAGLAVCFRAAEAGDPPSVPHAASAQHATPASRIHTTRRLWPTMPVHHPDSSAIRFSCLDFHCLDEAGTVKCLPAGRFPCPPLVFLSAVGFPAVGSPPAVGLGAGP